MKQTTQEAFAPLRTSNMALLTSYRRNGQGVSTPVGIRVANGKAYFTTWSTTGKIKRIANDPCVTLAPCTRRGNVLGPTLEGSARPLEGPEARQAGTRSLRRSRQLLALDTHLQTAFPRATSHL